MNEYQRLRWLRDQLEELTEEVVEDAESTLNKLAVESQACVDALNHALRYYESEGLDTIDPETE